MLEMGILPISMLNTQTPRRPMFQMDAEDQIRQGSQTLTLGDKSHAKALNTI